LELKTAGGDDFGQKRVLAPRLRQFGLLVLALLLLLLLLALPQAEAFGAGGKDIASAPAVVYGQQQLGNTAEGSDLAGSCGLFGGFSGCCETAYREFWSLSVTAGDLLTIDWESQVLATELKLLPVGTTDFNVFQTEVVASQSLPGNGKNELKYTASQNGAMPLDFRVCEATPGPYDFIATDQHALVVSLNSRAYIIPTNTLTAHAYLADGSPVPNDLEFWLNAYWRRHGFAQYRAVSSGGSVRFPLALPRSTEHHAVTFVVVRPAGARYQAVTSARLRVHVNPPAFTHHGHGHRHHHHRRHSR
jgi:hypothetical protein